jgi:division protein CdvB (Snf7/Vps24/ESCRT-III family)
MSFSTKWIKPQAESVGIKIMENIKPQPPLKPRIEEAQKKLQMQIAKLDSISIKTEEKDQLVFKRVIQAVQNHESQYAKVLSGELAQIRKMNKMVNSAKLALEQIQLRLNTITELGDVVVTLSPAMSVIKGIQSGLSSMMPEADHSLSQISDMLSGILTDSAQIPAAELNNTKVMTEDSLKIIEEATAIVEQSMKEKFPDLPSIGLGSKDAEATLY